MWRNGWRISMFFVLVLLIAFAASSAKAAPRFEMYPRSMIVNYSQGLGSKFQSRLTLTPVLTIHNGIASVHVRIGRKDLANVPARGIGRVSWEIELTNCNSSSAITKIELRMTNRTVALNKRGQVQMLIGEGVHAIIVHYKWVRNQKTLTYTQGRLIDDRPAERQSSGFAAGSRLVTTPEVAARDRREEAMKKLAKVKTLLAEAKSLRSEAETLVKKSDQQMKHAGKLIAAARNERDPGKRRALLALAERYRKSGKMKADTARKKMSEYRALHKQVLQLGHEAEAELHDLQQFDKAAQPAE